MYILPTHGPRSLRSGKWSGHASQLRACRCNRAIDAPRDIPPGVELGYWLHPWPDQSHPSVERNKKRTRMKKERTNKKEKKEETGVPVQSVGCQTWP